MLTHSRRVLHSGIVFLKLLGVATAVAVLIDATIVRASLVPSLMKLLGERNWWPPGPAQTPAPAHRPRGDRRGAPTPSEA